MEIVIFWIVCGVIAGMIGSNKGSGCAGFALGLLLGPLGIIIALIMKGNQKKCPFCKGDIPEDATTCKHCGKDIDPSGDSSDNDDESDGKIFCMHCGKEQSTNAVYCNQCGKKVFE